MSAVNTKLIEVNSMVMAGNEEIVKFNAQQIETNKKLLEGILAEKATPEADARDKWPDSLQDSRRYMM